MNLQGKLNLDILTLDYITKNLTESNSQAAGLKVILDYNKDEILKLKQFRHDGERLYLVARAKEKKLENEIFKANEIILL